MINNVYWRSTPQLINHGLAKSGVDMNRYMGIFHRQMGTYWDFVRSGDGNNDDICAGVPVGNRQVGLVRFNATRVYGIYIIYIDISTTGFINQLTTSYNWGAPPCTL